MERYANLARKLLVQFRPDVPASLPSDRRRLVTSIELALARRARKQLFRKQLIRGTAIAAAAMLLLAGGLSISRFLPAPGAPAATATVARRDAVKSLRVLEANRNDAVSDGAVFAEGAEPRPVARGMMLESGTRLVAPATNEVRIGSADGTTLTLEPGGELTVIEQSASRRYALSKGAVRAQVAKLHAGERFIIATEDGEVEVHGTVFRVATVPGSPSCRNGVKTRVTVFEGVVSVRSGGAEAFIPGGGSWPEGCAAGDVSAAPTESESAAAGAGTRASSANPSGLVRERRHLRHRAHGTRHRWGRIATAAAQPDEAPAVASESPAAPSATLSSDLAAQNDLFAAAVRARRERRTLESLDLFSQLVDRYPNGPLTEGAMVQRMRLLAATDDASAAHAADEYLARFPAGFARAQARRIAGAAP
jgi:hypothetical protein